ncbi:phosphatase PAP2 family protein [Rhodococcus sp. UNC363MFTsu5.1]|uniref:phosphatase PAP2 family protein n=1 Tax=Rhodococcus sp. UNC363MFTsu5.1 TaxID=1449069 RepID=UPI002F35EA0E
MLVRMWTSKRKAGTRAPRYLPGATIAAMSAIALMVVHSVFVTTEGGQLVDQQVMRAANAAPDSWHEAGFALLGAVNAPFIAAAIGAIVLIGLIRRRPRSIVVALAVIAGANLTTQVVKQLLDRPYLGWGAHNTLPSGHVTVITSLAVGLAMVLTPGSRSAAAALTCAAAAAAGSAVMICQWHRPSDVIAAVLVVVGWAAMLWPACAGRRDRYPWPGWTPIRSTSSPWPGPGSWDCRIVAWPCRAPGTSGWTRPPTGSGSSDWLGRARWLARTGRSNGRSTTATMS